MMRGGRDIAAKALFESRAIDDPDDYDNCLFWADAVLSALSDAGMRVCREKSQGTGANGGPLLWVRAWVPVEAE